MPHQVRWGDREYRVLALQVYALYKHATTMTLQKSAVHVLIREENEGRKSTVKQTRQSNTAHLRQSLFQKKNELPRV